MAGNDSNAHTKNGKPGKYYRNTDESTHETLVEEYKNSSRRSFYYD